MSGTHASHFWKTKGWQESSGTLQNCLRYTWDKLSVHRAMILHYYMSVYVSHAQCVCSHLFVDQYTFARYFYSSPIHMWLIMLCVCTGYCRRLATWLCNLYFSLFIQLTTCESKGDYDAFTLQEVLNFTVI